MSDEEKLEAQRARGTPLAVRFELMGCEFAHMAFTDDRIVPLYIFHPTCPYGKTVPDQDCRNCRHGRVVPVGNNAHLHLQRYLGHGAVFPVRDEDTADALITVLEEHDGLPLQRPAWHQMEEEP